jgi:tRNA A37 threonylcarbamoyladenosine biosynthesis protein TsaE
LEKPQELAALDFEQLVSNPNNLIMVEWPENIDLKEIVDCALLEFNAEDDSHEISIK